MQCRLGLLALLYLSIGCFAWTASDAFGAQVGDPPFGVVNPEASSELQVYAHSESSLLEDNKRSRKLPFGLRSEWIADSESGLFTAKVDTTLPLLCLGTPPPLVKFGFGFTDLFAAESFGLPEDLYEYSVGLSWVRPVNNQWTVRTMLGVGLATDNRNTSSDAWQFRGGAFAMYKRDDQTTWTFGVLATGRDDLPVIPAVGVVWRPSPLTRIDLLFPQPKISRLVWDDGSRQQWAYLGFGINGSTWAYERTGMFDDRLTYKDSRFLVGWESRPSASAGMPYAVGRTIRAEIGYVFSREFEFESETRVENLGDGLMFGVLTKF